MTKIKKLENSKSKENKKNIHSKKPLKAKTQNTINKKIDKKKDDQSTKKKELLISKRETKISEPQIEDQPKVIPKLSEEEQKERDKRTIFIGNLPSNTKKQQLYNLLNQYGKMVSCRFRRPNGKKILNKMKADVSNIIAYAVLESVEEAEKCINLNGASFKDHHIRVTKLEKNCFDNEDAAKRTIFVGNLKYSATDEKLHNIFSTCGNIEYVRTINNEMGCSGCAYVCFEKRESVGLAMELDKTLLDDRPINVEKYSKNKKNKVSKKKTEKITSGFERRMMKKMSKELGKKMEPTYNFSKKNGNKIKSKTTPFVSKENKEKGLKKSNYRGIKVDAKKQKKKKSKKRHPLNELARKIAPKD